MTACATKTAQLNEALSAPSNIKTIADLTQIAFEWSPINDERVAGFNIYRATQSGDGDSDLKLVGEVKSRFATHWTDSGLAPAQSYIYEIRAFDASKAISPAAQRVIVSTETLIPSVSFAQATSGLPSQAKILWRPHTDGRVNGYIIERSELSSDKWSRVAEIKGRLSAEYIDTSLDPNRHYQYRIFAKTFDGVTSSPSDAISATTKPLPPEVQNLRATTNQPKKIVLSWDASEAIGISHYTIYRAKNEIFPLTKLAETAELTYTDEMGDGERAFYRVTAVDSDGLESPRQQLSVAGASLSAPREPVFTAANFNGSAIELKWAAGSDMRAIRFVLIKNSSSGEESFELNENSYIDAMISPNQTYKYQLIGFDEFGLSSKPSRPAVIEVK